MPHLHLHGPSDSLRQQSDLLTEPQVGAIWRTSLVPWSIILTTLLGCVLPTQWELQSCLFSSSDWWEMYDTVAKHVTGFSECWFSVAYWPVTLNTMTILSLWLLLSVMEYWNEAIVLYQKVCVCGLGMNMAICECVFICELTILYISIDVKTSLNLNLWKLKC